MLVELKLCKETSNTSLLQILSVTLQMKTLPMQIHTQRDACRLVSMTWLVMEPVIQQLLEEDQLVLMLSTRKTVGTSKNTEVLDITKASFQIST